MILFSIPLLGRSHLQVRFGFFRTLFWINIIFHFLHKWFGKNDYILFVITLMIGFAAMLATDYNIYLPMGLDAALVGVAFAGTGYFLKQMSQKKNINFFFHINIVIYIVIAVLHKKLIFLNGFVNFRTGEYQNIFLTYFNAVLGTILLWNLSNWLKQIINKWEKVNFIKVIEKIGANTLTFVCLNQLVIIVVSQRLGVEILENSNIPYFKETVMLFVVCFILYVMMVVLENR